MKQDYLVTLRLKEDTETFQAFWYADNLISAAVSAKREVEKSLLYDATGNHGRLRGCRKSGRNKFCPLEIAQLLTIKHKKVLALTPKIH